MRIEQRGHRHIGGIIGEYREERHWGADLLLYGAIATAALAGAASAYGTYEAGQQRAEAASYNKKVAENQAAYATQQAEIEAQNLAERQKRQRASQRVAIGASGIDEEGSPLLVEADTARQQARDLYLTRYGGEVRAHAAMEEAGLQTLYGRQAQQAGAIGAGTALLSTGAGIVANTYYGRGGYYRYGG